MRRCQRILGQLFSNNYVRHTVVAEEAKGFLGLDGDEASDEVVDDGSDQDEEQEDLGLGVGGGAPMEH